MNEDDIRKKLSEAGIGQDGKWSKTKAREAQAPLLEKQRLLLEQLEGLLVQQIAQDTAQVSDLHAKLQILKHGGGRQNG